MNKTQMILMSAIVAGAQTVGADESGWYGSLNLGYAIPYGSLTPGDGNPDGDRNTIWTTVVSPGSAAAIASETDCDWRESCATARSTQVGPPAGALARPLTPTAR